MFLAVVISLGMMQRGGTGERALALQHGGDFECYQTIQFQILLSLQLDNLLWHGIFGRAPCPLPLNSPWFEIPGGFLV